MDDDLQRAYELVYRFGWNTTCFQILNPGMRRWFGEDGGSMVGYVRADGFRVVAGAPVVHESNLKQTIAEWESSDGGSTVCYFCAESRLESALHEAPGYSKVVVGAQPCWTAESWLQRARETASLRAQFSRAMSKGVRVSEWPLGRVKQSADLRNVLDHWLQTRGLPPMHFLIEPQIFERPDGRRIFVAEREGVPIGFVSLAPIPAREGWLTEMFVRGKNAPNGTVELTLREAISAIAADGSKFVSMGMVPLSKQARIAMSVNPAWLRSLAAWARAHMRRFYNFDGLDFFKSKFIPDVWEPVYAISTESRFSLRALLAVVRAFTGVHPAAAF